MKEVARWSGREKSNSRWKIRNNQQLLWFVGFQNFFRRVAVSFERRTDKCILLILDCNYTQSVNAR